MSTAKSIILGLKKVIGYELIHKDFGIVYYNEDEIETYLVRNFIMGDPDLLHLEAHCYKNLKNRVDSIFDQLHIYSMDPQALMVMPRYEYLKHYQLVG